MSGVKAKTASDQTHHHHQQETTMDASVRLDATADSTFATYAYARTADETANASASSRDPLPVVLKAALAHVERADRAEKSAADHRTSAGLRFKELKDRVQAGEVGKVTWAGYCAEHIPQLDQRTVERYISIAAGTAANVGGNGSSQHAAQSSPAEEEEMRKHRFKTAWEDASRRRRSDGVKCTPEDAFTFWRMGDGQPDSSYARSAWNAMCDDYDKGQGKVWDGMKDAPFHAWRNARGFPDDAKAHSMWEKGDLDGHRDGYANVDGSAKSSTTSDSSDKRKAQYAESKRRQRAKASTIREANGGKASKPRMDKETNDQYQRLAMLAKVMDAGQLQIINEIIEERWPGTEAKARKANAERDAA
jgi:hypothetical protein